MSLNENRFATTARPQAFAGCRRAFLGGVIGLFSASIALGSPQASSNSPGSATNAVTLLAQEVRDLGWVVYGARSAKGDWDLFACRPDGSELRAITRTAEFSEFSPQVSRDGQHLLYRRVGRDEKLDNNRHGEQGALVIANADGTEPDAFGKDGEFTWASWSPDGKQIASLSIKGIALIDVATKRVTRSIPRKGFFQQLTWSPDGQWLIGVANSYGTGWSIARMNVSTGLAEAVNRVDCCTPDWFPDSQNVIFSWRPPGQKANQGYGWTQLWRADAEGKTRQLVYGEDGRHVYGGCVSPDGKYALFTGNVQEDGDPGNAGAPMGLMRLSDGPIISGESTELRALHPQVNNGPVLELPGGWEPCWTMALAGFPQRLASAAKPSTVSSESTEQASDCAVLASEVRSNGWLVFSSRTSRGDWDLFRMRPDGTEKNKFLDMAGFNEGGARFSPDGKHVLFYRLPLADQLQNNEYGTGELVVASADGSQPNVLGSGFPWATWSPDSRQLACLTPKGILVVDFATRKTVRQLARKGIVSQLSWSPDGKWFTGTASHLGPFWNIALMNAESGEIRAVSETDRYNCTPDWVTDSQRIVYARGIIPENPGRAELWAARIDGQPPELLYAEEDRHIYGACASPDLKYLVFTRSVADLTKVDLQDTEMAVIRWADAPIRGGDGQSLRQRLPEAKTGPRLDLGAGWEPSWTGVDLLPPTRKQS